MKLFCPLCHATLQPHGHQAHCCHCDKTFAIQPCCPECHQPLEVLAACGAVNYFCNNGHGLLSKKQAEYCLQSVDETL
ncbi:zinc ribbon domain-containing protein [Enterobacteriaceae bacterium ESL0689]|nr:zinc ribbon domain-containing protein [Enterobacteriaceae bacterium ESL0689]